MVTRTFTGQPESDPSGNVASIRCATCHGTLEMEIGDADLEISSITCARCGHVYQGESLSLLASTNDLFHELTQQLADENDIDLSDAYSVLLGIMSLEQVLEIGRPDAVPDVPYASLAGAGKYDPAFAPAVEAGLLTARQAFEKGNRSNLASRLAERHRLSIEQAYEVVDNRLPLREAVAKRGRIEIITVQPARRSRLRAWTMALTTVLVLAAAGVGTWHVAKMVGAEGPAAGTRVLTDDSGRVVEIVASEPLDVLDIYCDRAADVGRQLEALGLLPPALPSSRVRVGILRDPADRDALLAIPIRQEGNPPLWTAGNGRTPITPVRAPDEAATSFRFR